MMNILNIASAPAPARSISDDDLCAECARCDYRPGETSVCAEGWPTAAGSGEYVLECVSFAKQEHEAAIVGELQILGFGMAPEAAKMGYGPIVELFYGTAAEAKAKFTGRDVILVTGAAVADRNEAYEFAVMARKGSDGVGHGALS